MIKQAQQLLRSRKPVVHVCSFHPLVMHVLMSSLERARGSPWVLKAVSSPSKFLEPGHSREAVVFDVYSILRWEHMLRQWIAKSVRPIALVASSFERADRLRLLDLGVQGIVNISAHLNRELVAAVKAVLRGKLWVDRALLEAHVRRTDTILKHMPGTTHSFTRRERQVLQLLLQEYTNKQIAALLDISERTAKFHVGNILLKTKTEARQELIHSTKSHRLDLLTAS